jgi:hypothetical protein
MDNRGYEVDAELGKHKRVRFLMSIASSPKR